MEDIVLYDNMTAYLNHEYRFWKITNCKLDEQKQKKALEELRNVIKLEEA